MSFNNLNIQDKLIVKNFKGDTILNVNGLVGSANCNILRVPQANPNTFNTPVNFVNLTASANITLNNNYGSYVFLISDSAGGSTVTLPNQNQSTANIQDGQQYFLTFIKSGSGALSSAIQFVSGSGGNYTVLTSSARTVGSSNFTVITTGASAQYKAYIATYFSGLGQWLISELV